MAEMVRNHPLAEGAARGAAVALPRLDDARLRLEVLADITALQIMALPGAAGALASALSLDPVRPGMADVRDALAFLPLAPGQWLAFARSGTADAGALEVRIGAGGYLCDLGDGLVAVEISGDLARAALARGCRLDLDRWAAGSCARTEMAGMTVILYRPGPEEKFVLLFAASMARSFWHWLHGAAISALSTG